VSKFLFYKLWIPIFPIVVLRGHISPCTVQCLWFRCVGTRKPLRQAVHEGFISLSQSDKSIILCFYAFDRLRKYTGSLDDSSPLSLQFSTWDCFCWTSSVSLTWSRNYVYSSDENYVFRKVRLCVMMKQVKFKYKYMWNKSEC
jgi:hypothetical protein